MLQELHVENLLLIERAELRLAPGLNVLTGETGAGKTVLAHALDLLLGGRARPGIVRPGAGEAYVEGAFELPEPLGSELRDLGARFVSFYGQHEHRRLTISTAQLELLDDICGPDHALRLRACAEAF